MKAKEFVSYPQNELREAIPDSLQFLITQTLSGICGFFLAQTGIFGEYAPFGIGFVAGAPAKGGLAALVGASMGYISLQSGVAPLRYIATVIAVYIIRRTLQGMKGIFKGKAIMPAVSLVCSLATGLALASTQGFTVNLVLMYGAEALLAAGSSFFFAQTFLLLDSPRNMKGVSKTELSCIIISICMMLMSLSQFEIQGISPVRIVASIGILIAGRFGRESAGSIAGAAAGITMSLANPEMAHLAGAYAFAGLLCGVFSPLGRFGSAAAFAVANGIIALLQEGSPAAINGLYETAGATILFMFFPIGWGKRIESYFNPIDSQPVTDGLRKSMISRLDFAANAMSEVSEAVEAVSEKLKKIYANDLDEVYHRVQNTVCSKCGLRLYCWENVYNESLNVFNMFSQKLKEKEILEKDDAPEYFANRCIKMTQVVDSFNHSYADFITKSMAEGRISEIRSIVADQFGGISEMLIDLAREFHESERFDPEAATRCSAIMKAFGVEPINVTCRLDKYSRMTVEVTAEVVKKRVDRISITKTLNEACGRLFDLPTMITMGNETRLIFSERASITIQTGAYQYAYMNGSLCGDAYESFQDGRGREIMIISDGMGSGGRAAVDGAMAAGLISRLVKAGFGFDCSLKVVNSALLVKSGDESLATLDIVSVDLFTGYTEFLKAGAAPTFVRRSGKAGKIEQSSLPAGILRQVEFGKTSLTLSPGDIVLMVSDGAINGSADWIIAELESWKEGTANELAEKIANEAKNRRTDNHDDDITALAAFLKRGS